MGKKNSSRTADIVLMSPAVRQVLETQRNAFRAKFGRDPRADDPVLFDPAADEPQPHPGFAHEIADALESCGTPPEQIYAFRRTGRLGIAADKGCWPPHAIAEWDAAVAEFLAAPPDVADIAARLGYSITDAGRWVHSHRHPAFKGTLELDIELSALDEKVQRRIRLEYTYTPEWEYFDTHLQQPYIGWESWRLGISLYTQPEEEDEDEMEDIADAEEDTMVSDGTAYLEDDDPHPPAWVRTDLVREGVLPRRVHDKFEELIDQKCRAEDKERRRATGL